MLYVKHLFFSIKILRLATLAQYDRMRGILVQYDQVKDSSSVAPGGTTQV